MTVRHDELKHIIVEGMAKEVALMRILKCIVDRYPDATAVEIADALRLVDEKQRDAQRAERSSR